VPATWLGAASPFCTSTSASGPVVGGAGGVQHRAALGHLRGGEAGQDVGRQQGGAVAVSTGGFTA
jgi:hypothetical protein